MIAAAAIDRAGARIGGRVAGALGSADSIGAAHKRDAWLQAEEVGNVALGEGQGGDLLAVEGVADGGVGGIQQLGCGFVDRDLLGDGGQLEGDVGGGGLADQQVKVGALAGGKAGGHDHEGVRAGRQLGELVLAAGIGGVVTGSAGGCEGEPDRGAGDDRAGAIGDPPVERGGGLRAGGGAGCEKEGEGGERWQGTETDHGWLQEMGMLSPGPGVLGIPPGVAMREPTRGPLDEPSLQRVIGEECNRTGGAGIVGRGR